MFFEKDNAEAPSSAGGNITDYDSAVFVQTLVSRFHCAEIAEVVCNRSIQEQQFVISEHWRPSRVGLSVLCSTHQLCILEDETTPKETGISGMGLSDSILLLRIYVSKLLLALRAFDNARAPKGEDANLNRQSGFCTKEMRCNA